ncbi:DUF4260 family protein [Microbacterium sp. YY-01]|uniref:DUF4260 family protein n=1 Tax=Microbacterium sp. YY-01 TaxID=3421634 RepID=UPI003D164C56
MTTELPPVHDRKPTAVVLQRIENGVIAIAILAAVIVAGLPWWVLFAAFLLFDLSALGYVRNARVGAFWYNIVHNYAAPAAIMGAYVIALAAGIDVRWIALLAACWGFHVAVDRALGYGLKAASFSETHLGRIGRQ